MQDSENRFEDRLDSTLPSDPEGETILLPTAAPTAAKAPVPLVEPTEAHPLPRAASEANFTQVSPAHPPVSPLNQQTHFQPTAQSGNYSAPIAQQVRETTERPRTESPRVNTRPQKAGFDWRWLLLAIPMLIGSIVVSLAALIIVPILSKSPALAMGNDTPTPLPTIAVATPTDLPAVTPSGIQAWDGTQRYTILMMGLDKRPGDTGTSFRTDSMIIVSLDPKTKSIGMLSVPRDLFVEVPADNLAHSYGLQRVNSAYAIGELIKVGHGPVLAMETVQYNLGIRIDNYLVYDFSAVINAIDAVGGIDIDVPYAINDPTYPNMYYGYDPLYIPAGHVHMDGALALKYARTRHQTDDLDRARRQQEVIMAVRNKILSLNLIPNLMGRAPAIWSQLSTSVRSGMSLDQLISFALFAKDISKENIHQGVLDWTYVKSIVYNGADVLVPERAKIGPLLIKVFGSNYSQD